MIGFDQFTQIIETFKKEFEPNRINLTLSEEDQIDTTLELVFKKCLPRYLTILARLKSSLTNEGRKNVVIKETAPFRADRLFIAHNVDLRDGSNVESVENEFHGILQTKTLIYKAGTIVKADCFDANLDEVWTNGIGYYLTFEPAYYYKILENDNYFTYNGPIKTWHDNGVLEELSAQIEGHRDGLTETWHDDNKRNLRYNTIGFKIVGPFERWHKTGHQCVRANYYDGVLHGLMEVWDEDGTLLCRSHYVRGNLHGLNQKWNHDATVRSVGMYDNDVLVDGTDFDDRGRPVKCANIPVINIASNRFC